MKIQASVVALFALFLHQSNAAFLPGARGAHPLFLARTNDKQSSTSVDMASSGQMSCRPIGIGAAAPKTVITNLDMESVVETNDEWIRARTGISERRVLLKDETIRALGVEAARQALDMAGISAADIDLVICATSSPDDIFGDATVIASEIGCTKETVAFDLTAACSGFLFASVTAGQFLSTPGSSMKNALVIGADALSRWVDWDDRNSCILFGDGAGAMVLTNQGDEAAGLLGYSAHSNGHGYGELNCG
jgi:3-oxoacyl-[acyl-carrier-protein] synthase III